MKYRLALFLGAIAILLSGCRHGNQYEIELKPDADGVERQLTCWRVGDKLPFPAEQLAFAEVFYGRPPEKPAPEKFRFTGRFAGKMPHDVGGAGTYTVFATPMGSIAVYSERFRGNDDLVEQFEERGKVAERLANLVAEWFESQMGQDRNWPQVHRFLTQDFRRDLHNLSLYFWRAQAKAADDPPIDNPPTEKWESFAPYFDDTARISQYFSERGYFEPGELLDWAKAMNGSFSSRASAQLLQKVVAKKAGLENDEAVHSLDFLSDVDRVVESWNGFLERTTEFEDALRAWEEEKTKTPTEPRPIPDDVFWGIVAKQLLRWKLVTDTDEVKLALATVERPFATNGRWDEQHQQVRWNQPIDGGGSLPTYCYAVWSDPNSEFQIEHFGRVVVRDRVLADYAATYLVLTGDEEAQWDQLTVDLRPGERLRASIQAFVVKKEQPQLKYLKELLLAVIK
jgi:hypothetical protein